MNNYEKFIIQNLKYLNYLRVIIFNCFLKYLTLYFIYYENYCNNLRITLVQSIFFQKFLINFNFDY